MEDWLELPLCGNWAVRDGTRSAAADYWAAHARVVPPRCRPTQVGAMLAGQVSWQGADKAARQQMPAGLRQLVMRREMPSRRWAKATLVKVTPPLVELAPLARIDRDCPKVGRQGIAASAPAGCLQCRAERLQ